MRKLLKHKKALSPVVAAIILIAVTVAVSIAVAAWMGALTIGFMGTEELRVLGVDFSTADQIKINVKNTGTTSVVISEVRAGGISVTGIALEGQADLTLPAGVTDNISGGFVWVAGTSYDFEVVTAKGNIFPYRAYAPEA